MCPNPKCISQKQITSTSTQIQLEGSGSEKKNEKNFQRDRENVKKLP